MVREVEIELAAAGTIPQHTIGDMQYIMTIRIGI